MGSAVNAISNTVSRVPGANLIADSTNALYRGVTGIGDMFNRKSPDLSGLQGIQDAALGMYQEGSNDYAAQTDNRKAFAQQLADRALGNGPSIANAQMNVGLEKSLAQQLAAAKSNRAVNPALAFRQTQNLGAQAQQQIAQASGIARMQEQQQNQGAYQNYFNNLQNSRFSALSAGSGAAQSMAAANAAEAASRNQFNGQLLGGIGQIGAMAAMASDKKLKKNIKKEGASKDSNMTALSDERQKTDVVKVEPQYRDFNTLMKQFDVGNPAEGALAGVQKGLMFRGKAEAPTVMPATAVKIASTQPELASTLGFDQGSLLATDPKKYLEFVNQFNQDAALAPTQPPANSSFYKALSDRNQKKNVEDFNPKNFLDALQAYSYEYKDPSVPGAGEGRHLSVMAQDLEKAGPVGQSMVKDTPTGKIVDYGKGFGAILAAQAHLNERMKEIEARYGPRSKA